MDKGAVASDVQNIDRRPGFYLHKLSPGKINKADVYVAVSQDMSVNRLVAHRLESLTRSEKVESAFKPILPSEVDNVSINKNSNVATFIFRTVAYPREYDWLDRLSGVLEMHDVSCVAPRILMADGGRIADMGIVYTVTGEKYPLFRRMASDDQTLVGHVEWVRDVDELSGAIVGFTADTIKRKKYNVVWSYVMFSELPIFGQSNYFNSNIYPEVDEDGYPKVSVNG
jgi:hypothetical protein